MFVVEIDWSATLCFACTGAIIIHVCVCIYIYIYVYIYIYLKASPLPPAPLAVAGVMVVGLVAWQYSDRLAGLLDLAVRFFAVLVSSAGLFAGSLASGCYFPCHFVGICSCLATALELRVALRLRVLIGLVAYLFHLGGGTTNHHEQNSIVGPLASIAMRFAIHLNAIRR